MNKKIILVGPGRPCHLPYRVAELWDHEVQDTFCLLSLTTPCILHKPEKVTTKAFFSKNNTVNWEENSEKKIGGPPYHLHFVSDTNLTIQPISRSVCLLVIYHLCPAVSPASW